MQKANILTINFLHLLRGGAFEETKPIGLLSAYKWAKLVSLAAKHGLTQILASGLERYYYDDNMNIPAQQIDVIKEQLKTVPTAGFSDLYDFSKLHLQSKKYNTQLQQIIHSEYTDEEKSYETMQVMAIIIVNVDHILTGKSYLKGIIDLGRYLRIEGGKVDFVKLENWLSKCGMTKMANLQGSLLITGFGFSREELPFMTRPEKDVWPELLRAISSDDISHIRPWQLHENTGGFLVGNPSTAMRSIRHTFRYRRYSARETFSTIYRGIMKGLSEIEE